MKLPLVGLAFGAGLLIAESSILTRGMMASFGSAGVARHYAVALAVYLVLAVAGDLLVQLALLEAGSPRWAPAARALGGAVLLLACVSVFDLLASAATISIAGSLAWTASLTRRWAWPLTAAMLLVALRPALPQERAPRPDLQALRVEAEAPSFAVVVLDTMRRDRSSTYGHVRETTPNLTALARRGVLFERGYAVSCWSIPTHASLLTGLMPNAHGAHFESFRMPGGTETLATLFSKVGYETAGFSGNPYISEGTGFARGFRHWSECWREHVTRRLMLAGPIWAALTGADVDKGGRDVVAALRDWTTSRDPERPYFAFVNLMEAHGPYQDVPRESLELFVSPELSRGTIEQAGNASHEAQWMGTPVGEEEARLTLDLIDAATHAADRYLGEVLEALPGDPFVVVVSDHGDLLGEHELWGHMTSLYEPLIHVPFVLAGPGLPEGLSVPDPVSHVDVLPTFVDALGFEPPESAGLSLLPLLRGEESLMDRVLHAEHFRADRATALWEGNVDPIRLPWIRARKGASITTRLKRVVSEDGIDAAWDLVTDPLELRPFPGESVPLEASVPEAPAPVESAPDGSEMDEAQREALRALGYVQ